MSKLDGVNISGPVVPTDTDDTYATHYEDYGVGGYRTVANITARDAIPVSRRKQGMKTLVLDDVIDNTEYELRYGITNNDWGIDKKFFDLSTIPGTTTTVTKTGDNITQVQYKVGSTVVRQDDLSYPDSNTIVEKKTCLLTNEEITTTYNLTTLGQTATAIAKVVG